MTIRKYLPSGRQWWYVVAGIILAAILVTIALRKKKGGEIVTASPGKSPPSGNPAFISPNAGGEGSKEQDPSPARNATALQKGGLGLVTEGASIAAQKIGDTFSGIVGG